jgi:predicted nucleotidyltransferase
MTTTELNQLITDLKKITEKIILFGSCATGDDTSESDIDLFILTQDTKKVNDYLKKERLERTIQAVVVNAPGLVKLREKDKAFYQEINKGIVLRDGKNDE